MLIRFRSFSCSCVLLVTGWTTGTPIGPSDKKSGRLVVFVGVVARGCVVVLVNGRSKGITTHCWGVRLLRLPNILVDGRLMPRVKSILLDRESRSPLSYGWSVDRWSWTKSGKGDVSDTGLTGCDTLGTTSTLGFDVWLCPLLHKKCLNDNRLSSRLVLQVAASPGSVRGKHFNIYILKIIIHYTVTKLRCLLFFFQ